MQPFGPADNQEVDRATGAIMPLIGVAHFRSSADRLPSRRGFTRIHGSSLSMCLIVASMSLIATTPAPAFGQGTTLVSAAYNKPKLVVSPGQVISFFVTGLQTVLAQSQKAETLPLPLSLAGISVDIEQVMPIGTTSTVYSAPLLSVEQIDNCGLSGSQHTECLVTAITLQVPYELFLAPAAVLSPKAVVIENGTPSREFTLSLVPSSPHILTRCEPALQQRPCSGVVTHADGSLITRDSPAAAGETVVVYAYGLGPTLPAVKTGQASPASPESPVAADVTVQFDFRPNAMPSHPYAATARPAFVGLTPGQVGLYQINVTLPSNVPSIPPCTVASDATDVVQSNLTINIGVDSAFDGAVICIQPPQ